MSCLDEEEAASPTPTPGQAPPRRGGPAHQARQFKHGGLDALDGDAEEWDLDEQA